jgi:hypothetical protein
MAMAPMKACGLWQRRFSTWQGFIAMLHGARRFYVDLGHFFVVNVGKYSSIMEHVGREKISGNGGLVGPSQSGSIIEFYGLYEHHQ